MPPISGNPDEINIGIGIDGVDDVDRAMSHVEQIVNNSVESITKAFNSKSNYTKILNEDILKTEKAVGSLISQYSRLGKDGAAGIEGVSQRQEKALLQLTDYYKRLREIDIQSAKSRNKKADIVGFCRLLH